MGAKMLSNVKVVAFTQYLLGPAAAQYLGDMGADVIKVEPLSGSFERHWAGADSYLQGESTFFMLANRNVRSVALNLKHEKGLEAARRIVGDADVLLENYRPGVLERLGLGYEAVCKLRPDIVYASASAYGTDSAYRALPGQDLILQAMTGLAAKTGRAQDPPMAAGAAIVDQHAASLLAMGILGALVRRAGSGEGERVEVTMLEAALDLQLEPVVYHANGANVQRPREGLASSFHEAPYGFYETQDGHIALSMSPIRLIADALGGPAPLEPFKDPRLAFSHREEIYRAIAPLVRNRVTHELVRDLRDHGVWCAPVNDYDAAFEDPIVQEVDPFIQITHERAGTVRLLKHPIRYHGKESVIRHHPPTLGQHSREVLEELGYSAGEIDTLYRSGALGLDGTEA